MKHSEETKVEIDANEYWIKIVEFLQQNWALIEPGKESSGVTIYFFGDTSGVFDTIDYPEKDQAEKALLNNGFKKYLDPEEKFTEFISCPQPPFEWRNHPNGRIYSSGRFWTY